MAVQVRYAPIIITSPWAKLANLRMLNVKVIPIAPRAYMHPNTKPGIK